MVTSNHRNGFILQSLEDRTLFAGLTVIAHGIEPAGERAAWLDTTADAIVARTSDDTSIYALHVAPTEDPEFFDLTLEWLDGVAAAESDNAEIVLLIDWSDVSDPTASDTTVSDVGFFVSEYLFETDAELGIDFPWAELPIHLIGHGRGAGVVSELSFYLGEAGLWIDHLTLLDAPAPDLYPDDQPVAVYENVFYADAYYQTNTDQKGAPVTGAVNHDLSATVMSHPGMIVWYLDTISSGGTGVGYDFSRIHGGTRDPLGIGENFTPDGLGARDVVDPLDTQYPNVGLVTITDDDATIPQGHPLDIEFLFQDRDSDGEVEYYLDEDTNPYNDNAWFIGAGLCQSAGDEITPFTATLSTVELPSGAYHLFVFVTDSDGQVRYAYAGETVTLVTQPPTIGSLSRSASSVRDSEDLTLTANNVSPDARFVTFAHDTDDDGVYDPETDQVLDIDADGAGGWSWSGPIDHLPAGPNRFFAITIDADNLVSAPVTTTVTRDIGDEFENNDTRTAAHNLGLHTAITAYPHLNLLDDAKDWFRFRIDRTADRRHVLKINYKQSLGDLSLSLYNADGKLLHTSAHSTNKDLISLKDLPKGTYYARITGDAHPNYKLTIDAPSAPTRALAAGSAATAPTRFPFTFSLFNSKRRIIYGGASLL